MFARKVLFVREVTCLLVKSHVCQRSAVFAKTVPCLLEKCRVCIRGVAETNQCAVLLVVGLGL